MEIGKPSTIRWVGLFLALFSVLVVSTAVASHHDADGPSCLLCKLGHEPVELAVAGETSLAPPVADDGPGEIELAERAAPERSLRPRAPPL